MSKTYVDLPIICIFAVFTNVCALDSTTHQLIEALTSKIIGKIARLIRNTNLLTRPGEAQNSQELVEAVTTLEREETYQKPSFWEKLGFYIMYPMITTLLGLFFVLAGIICVYTMLEIRGRPKLDLEPKVLIKIHKISGYIFVLLYIVVLVLMIIKLRNYRVELPIRANIHILLAAVTLPILAIKIAAARVYKKLSAQLLFFGVLLFVFGFSLIAITGGYYLLQTTIDISSANKSLVEKKCSRCHSLEKAYSAVKTKESWMSTVGYMRNYNKQWISESDIPKIVDNLVQIRGIGE